MIENSYRLSIPAPDFLTEAMNVAPETKQWLGIYYTVTNPTWTDGGWNVTFSYNDVYYPMIYSDGMRIQLANARQKLKAEYNIDFGSDDTEPSHILLLHQHKYELYVAEFVPGMKFLQEQYPKSDRGKQIKITQEDLDKYVQEYRSKFHENMQEYAKYGMFEFFINRNVYQKRITNWFNNYCVN